MHKLTGQTFGRLTVVTFAGRVNKIRVWQCRCECGNVTTVTTANLVRGHTQSCGCLQRERSSANMRRVAFRHGKAGTPEWNAWMSMFSRCYDPNNKRYSRYGGRGIKVCERWNGSFENFLSDMGPRPSNKHTLDRLDNDGNYEPGNCGWRTKTQQNNNRGSYNVRIQVGDRDLTLAEWSRETGVSEACMTYRRSIGWTPEQIVGLAVKPAHGNYRGGRKPRRASLN